MEIGIDSFAAILPDPATGRIPSQTERIASLLEDVMVADQVGLDVFGVGEHHPPRPSHTRNMIGRSKWVN